MNAVSAPLPPGQPTQGPGGSDYKHASVITQDFGSGNGEYWIFTPADPIPAEAPVVLFLHGWGGMNPKAYGAWIEHIVRKGHIVVYPRYQATLLTSTSYMTQYAEIAVKDAWTRLSTGFVKPRTDRMAIVTHSLGGLIGANIAAITVRDGLPPVKAFMAAAPGGETSLLLNNLSTVPADCLVLLVVGDADTRVGDRAAKMIRTALPQIPTENLNLVTLHSDRRSNPPLIADHLAPCATLPTFPPQSPDLAESDFEAIDVGSTSSQHPFLQRLIGSRLRRNPHPPDALDFYGYWKLFDGLSDAAFNGTDRDYALGDTPQQTFMGRLSNGEAVTPPTVVVGQ
jgi:pimeloyl-ACP methyl ester carboxylesterase